MDALLGEQEAVILGVGGVHTLEVEAVGFEDIGTMGAQGCCRVEEQGVDGRVGKGGKG